MYLMTKSIFIIVAVDQENGFSKNGKIPWNLKKDLKYFRDITTQSKPNQQNVVIMGRVTYESIGKPLPNRLNIVLTSQSIPGVICCKTLKDAIQLCKDNKTVDKMFIIGGEKVYLEAYHHYFIQGIYRTVVMDIHQCDRFFIPIHDRFKLVSEELDQEHDVLFIRQYWENNFLA
jgi:dihydrofolate reductase